MIGFDCNTPHYMEYYRKWEPIWKRVCCDDLALQHGTHGTQHEDLRNTNDTDNLKTRNVADWNNVVLFRNGNAVDLVISDKEHCSFAMERKPVLSPRGARM